MFKKGDKVKRVMGTDYSQYNMIINNIYTVKECDKYEIWLDECEHYFKTSYFELVKESNDYEIY